MAFPLWNAGDKVAPRTAGPATRIKVDFQVEIVPADGTGAANCKNEKFGTFSF